MTNYKHVWCFFILFVTVLSGCNSSHKSVLDETSTEKCDTYFAKYLNGEMNRYEDTLTLSLEQIPSCQKAVWNIWKQVNEQFNEEKLPALTKLSEAQGCSWKLPENLEPNAVMPFVWGMKGEAKPQEGYPLYLYLHGSGPKDTEWAVGKSICNEFDDAPSVYFIPQIPNMGNYYRWWQKAKQFAWKRLLRQALLGNDINPNRIYCFGISEGGYGSQRMASFYADYLAAAGPMAGGEPLKNAPVENCRNIAFSFLTGELDAGFYRNKLTRYTAEEFKRMQEIYPEGYINRIELMPGCGHGIDYKLTTPWLKQYIRNPYPKSVAWENFEMDGLYRDCFYNLAVIERSNADESSRTYYEMNIVDNHIDLKVDLVTYTPIETDPQWGIQLKFEKSYVPATKGRLLIYLNDKLVDLSKEVSVNVNGKEVFNGMVKPEFRHLVNSCAQFFDPERLYPAAVEVVIGDQKRD